MSEFVRASLGRRERQIMDIVYRHGTATASQVLEELADPPTYSTVRGMLRYLEGKGFLRHERRGMRYVYMPTSPKGPVRRSALDHLVRTFFDGSVSSTVAALIETESLDESEYRRLARLIDDAARKDAQ